MGFIWRGMIREDSCLCNHLLFLPIHVWAVIFCSLGLTALLNVQNFAAVSFQEQEHTNGEEKWTVR